MIFLRIFPHLPREASVVSQKVEFPEKIPDVLNRAVSRYADTPKKLLDLGPTVLLIQ